MNSNQLNDLLEERDRVIETSEEFAGIADSAIESEEIRELRRIVMDTSGEDCTVFSST